MLARIGVVPDVVDPAAVDESLNKGESPRNHAARLADEKAAVVQPRHADSVILAADTVVALGRRVLPKADDEATARRCLAMLSGRRHKVIGGVTLIGADGRTWRRLVTTSVKFKRLESAEIDAYVASGEWDGKAGGYAIQGLAAAFIPWVNGSYASVGTLAQIQDA